MALTSNQPKNQYKDRLKAHRELREVRSQTLVQVQPNRTARSVALLYEFLWIEGLDTNVKNNISHTDNYSDTMQNIQF